MSLHDRYARVTPYEVALPPGPAREAIERKAADEAAARGADASDPQAFLTLGTAAGVVRELQGEGASQGAGGDYGALVFHAFRFHQAGAHLYLLSAAAARHLVEGAPDGQPDAPEEAGYLQLPQHLFWTASGGDGPPESLDGMFWSVSRRGLLHVLAVSGMRADRPGFGIVPLPEAPMAEAAEWLRARVREHGEDYESGLPGGELDRLLSVETAGELLKLLARFFAYVRAVPRAVEAPRLAPEGAGTDTDGPRPSGLPYRRVALVA